MNLKKKNNFSAFTLIELMVVITIVFTLSFMSYIPYSHHQKKVLLTQAAREISQSLSEVRNLAINGFNTGSWNLNIWLYFPSRARQIDYYTSTGIIDIASLDPSNIYKIKKLTKGVQVDTIAGNNRDTLFLFSAIIGTWSIYQRDSIGVITELTWNTIDIQISYKGASSTTLQKNIEYYRKSYISNY